MHPWLLTTPPVSSYGACLVTAVIAAWLLTRSNARRRGLDASHVDLLVPLLVVAGIAGAWGFGLWTRAVTGTEGGLVLAGAMVVPTVVGIVYARLAGIPLGVLGDLFAASGALAIAMGRVGCLLAGCCYGKACATGFPAGAGLRFPPGSVAFAELVGSAALDGHATETPPLLPVQLLEIAGCLVLMASVWKVSARVGRGRAVSGDAFLSLGGGYAVLRFFLEYLRADNPPAWAGLTFSQGVLLVVLAAALVTGWARRRWARRWGLAPTGFSPPTGTITGVGNEEVRREGCGPRRGSAPL
jgi:phosphatidylglycerol:prolipoprotein diacylglycerol transferase